MLLFNTASKTSKGMGGNLIKHWQDLYTHNCEILPNEVKEAPNHHVRVLEAPLS